MNRFVQLVQCHVFLLLTSLTLVYSIEENQPEIFLSPRNFNPHPYEANNARNVGANRGPVVFPPPPPEEAPEDNAVNRNVLVLSKAPNDVDNHPYAKVARKRKYKIAGRFSNLDNHVNSGVYEALSSHATKVLSKPPSQLGKDYIHSSLSNNDEDQKNYAFSYKVVDHLTGDDFSHTQSQDARATNGEYRVKLPDGRVQIVSYIADKNGYKADVKYTSEDDTTDLKIPQIRNKIRPSTILKTYDYQQYDDDINQSHLVQTELPLYDRTTILYTPSPTQQSKITPNYNPLNSYYTPKPVYYPKTVNDYVTPNPGNYQRQQQPKVEIYSAGRHINGGVRGGNYVVSTVAPYLYESNKHYQDSNIISSTLSPDLAGYNEVYLSTPKYRLVQNNQHNELLYKK